VELGGARVLVTGGTGFLGRHVGKALEAEGALPQLVGRADGDLTDPDETKALLKSARPDAVVHLAATVGGIGANRSRPAEFFFDNLLMGAHLIDQVHRQGVPRLLLVGTACSYPGTAPVATTESSLWEGYPEPTNAPYGIAKRVLFVQADAYRSQYGTDIVSVIPTNLFGPGDNVDLASGHVIPNLIRRFFDAIDTGSDEVVLWGDGSPTRDFLFVDDAARGCVMALASYDEPTPINLSSGLETSIAELANLISTMTGFGGSISWDTSMPNGQERRQLDAGRANELLGWTTKVPLEEGLAETIAWYQTTRASEW